MPPRKRRKGAKSKKSKTPPQNKAGGRVGDLKVGAKIWALVQDAKKPERRAAAKSQLAALALSGPGYCSTALRRKVWPVLLDVEGDTILSEPKRTTTKYEQQVHLDVERSLWTYVKDDKKRDTVRKQLQTLICEALAAEDAHYYQGLNDVAGCLLVTLGPSVAQRALRVLLSTSLKDHVHRDLSRVISHLRLLPALLQHADPEVATHISGSGVEPFWALAPHLTLFSHHLSDLGAAQRVLDFLLWGHPATTLYLVTALVVAGRSHLLATEQDYSCMHRALSQLPARLLPSGRDPVQGGGDQVEEVAEVDDDVDVVETALITFDSWIEYAARLQRSLPPSVLVEKGVVREEEEIEEGRMSPASAPIDSCGALMLHPFPFSPLPDPTVALDDLPPTSGVLLTFGEIPEPVAGIPVGVSLPGALLLGPMRALAYAPLTALGFAGRLLSPLAPSYKTVVDKEGKRVRMMDPGSLGNTLKALAAVALPLAVAGAVRISRRAESEEEDVEVWEDSAFLAGFEV